MNAAYNHIGQVTFALCIWLKGGKRSTRFMCVVLRTKRRVTLRKCQLMDKGVKEK